MREIKKYYETPNNGTIYHVISEPGDMTRYDYFIYQNYEDYSIMPCKSTFIFPQRLNWWDITNDWDPIGWNDIITMSEKYGCNPHTLKEIINTIIELRREKI